ncbi:MAG: hypothetical protein GXO35_07010, partial [Gammaproteobacteria bacterium]|nr:hypothetical protein [Gammaproteobacteria bacterium]
MFLGIITLCLTIIVLFFTFFSLRGTILDIRFPAQNPWPLFWYLELALILVPLNLISFLGLDNVQAIFVKDESVILSVNLWTLSSLLILSITLAFLMQLLGLKLDVIRIPKEFSNSLIKKLNIFSLSLTLFGIMLLLAFYNLGYKHAFLSALIEGKSLLHVRLFNKYFSKVPSQLASLLPLIGYLLAATSGYLSRIKFTKGLIYFLVALIFLSADGGKAPIV